MRAPGVRFRVSNNPPDENKARAAAAPRGMHPSRSSPLFPPVEEDLFVTPQRQREAALGLALRLLLWPLFLLRELLMLPRRLQWDEPPTAPPFHCNRLSKRLGLQPGFGRRVLDAMDEWLMPSHPVYLRRFVECYRHSWLLLWESTVYYLLVSIVEMLAVDVFMQQWQSELLWLSSKMAGTLFVAEEGNSVPLSPVAAVGVPFSLPYAAGDCFKAPLPPSTRGSPPYAALRPSPRARGGAASQEPAAELRPAPATGSGRKQPPRVSKKGFGPAADGPGECPRDAHLLCMCAGLAYEEESLISSVIGGWGMTLHSYHKLPAHRSRGAGYIPDIVWFVASTPSAVVLTFRGADPFFQVSRRADIPCAQMDLPGAGRVLEGFAKALEEQPEQGEGGTVYDWLLEELEPLLRQGGGGSGGGRRRLYLTGHSIGAALASIFAQFLHTRGWGMLEQLGGIVTFGQPRTGDATYADSFERHFGDRCLRYVCGCDMVTELPNEGYGYKHHGQLRFIAAAASPNAFFPGTAIFSGAAAKQMLVAADRGALGDAVRKLLRAGARGEGAARVFSRLTLLGMPGILDHFPGDYEVALREAVLSKGAARA